MALQEQVQLKGGRPTRCSHPDRRQRQGPVPARATWNWCSALPGKAGPLRPSPVPAWRGRCEKRFQAGQPHTRSPRRLAAVLLLRQTCSPPEPPAPPVRKNPPTPARWRSKDVRGALRNSAGSAASAGKGWTTLSPMEPAVQQRRRPSWSRSLRSHHGQRCPAWSVQPTWHPHLTLLPAGPPLVRRPPMQPALRRPLLANSLLTHPLPARLLPT
mmetsp:Transcript_61342/g.182725  ORF Transcript_61342/g.182725 Transcript_61342/m.182725 type:complete len:214 (+) Transcript_61342:1223-1864(+)